MSDRRPLARAMAGLKPYEQPFQGLHNLPYGAMLPPMGENMVNQNAPVINPPLAAPPPPVTSAEFGRPAPQPPPPPSMAAPQAQPPVMPPQAMMPPGSLPPVTMGQQAPQMPRNELERDYYRQLAASPQGFDRGWLGRFFG